MKPNLLIFKTENVDNDYIDFSKPMQPQITIRDLSKEEVDQLLSRRSEMLEIIHQKIFDTYLDETNEMSCAVEDESDFPCRTIMTGNYYVGRESYSSRFFDTNGHYYDIKDGKYRDLCIRDKNGEYNHFIPLDSAEVKRGYKILFEIRLTYYDKEGKERDYMSIDYVTDLYPLNGEMIVEELSMDEIIGSDVW